MKSKVFDVKFNNFGDVFVKRFAKSREEAKEIVECVKDEVETLVKDSVETANTTYLAPLDDNYNNIYKREALIKLIGADYKININTNSIKIRVGVVSKSSKVRMIAWFWEHGTGIKGSRYGTYEPSWTYSTDKKAVAYDGEEHDGWYYYDENVDKFRFTEGIAGTGYINGAREDIKDELLDTVRTGVNKWIRGKKR